VPAELARLVRAHARDASLRPVARIETRRRLTTLLDAAGTSLAEIAVDEVAAQSLGASTTLSRWNEIEIELAGWLSLSARWRSPAPITARPRPIADRRRAMSCRPTSAPRRVGSRPSTPPSGATSRTASTRCG
jgi:hypothetical protein